MAAKKQLRKVLGHDFLSPAYRGLIPMAFTISGAIPGSSILGPITVPVRLRWPRSGVGGGDPAQWPTFFAKATRMDWRGFSQDGLKAIKVPVLLAAGDHNFLGPRLESVLDTFRLIPNGQLVIVPDAGHCVLNENSMNLLPIIRSFFDEPISTVPFATIRTGYHPVETRS